MNYVKRSCQPRGTTLGLLLSVLSLLSVSGSGTIACGAEPPFRLIRDVEYVRRDTLSLKADLYLPQCTGAVPCLLAVHGGAWMAGSKIHVAWHARRLATEGFAVVAIDYRLAPNHKFPAQLEDCRAALQWIGEHAEQYSFDTERIGALGYSAGGHLVCLLGNSLAREAQGAAESDGIDQVAPAGDAAARPPRVRAIVAGGAPCEFRKVTLDSEQYTFWLGATRRQAPRIYELASPTHFVCPQSPPTFFYHGEQDRVVPLGDPQGLHQQLREVGVDSQLHVVKKVGHLGAFLDRAVFEQAVAFLDEQLQLDQSKAGQP